MERQMSEGSSWGREYMLALVLATSVIRKMENTGFKY